MKKVRFGIAGVGVIAREYHLPVMAANPRVAEDVAACSPNPSTLRLTAEQFGIPKISSDFHSLVNDPEIDAVLVAVPNSLHAPISVPLLEAGKHVLCEKPMAPTVAEACSMLRAAEKAGVQLAIAHPWRCDQDCQWLHEVVASGRLGKIFKIRCHAILTEGSPSLEGWRGRREMAGGGALTDLGIHAIDTVSFLLDDRREPRRVYARIANYFTKAEVEDTAAAVFEFGGEFGGEFDGEFGGKLSGESDGGLAVTIEAGWHHNFQNAPHGAIEVFGTEGYARTFPTELYCRIEGAWGRYEANLHPPRPHIDLSMYAAQLDAFIDCVVAGKTPPCSGRQGLRNVAWAAAAYESARAGEPVPFEPYAASVSQCLKKD